MSRSGGRMEEELPGKTVSRFENGSVSSLSDDSGFGYKSEDYVDQFEAIYHQPEI